MHVENLNFIFFSFFCKEECNEYQESYTVKNKDAFIIVTIREHCIAESFIIYTANIFV